MLPRQRKGETRSTPVLYPICLEPSCRWLFDDIGGLPEAAFQRELEVRGRMWREDRVRMIQLRALQKAEAAEAKETFAAIEGGSMKRKGFGAAPDLRLVVPSGRRPVRPLPQYRRRSYAAYLDEIIAEALLPPKPPAEPKDPPAFPPRPEPPDFDTRAGDSRLPGRLCGVCAGGCCPSGGTHAYLSHVTMRRVMAENPDLDLASLKQLYLDHLPPRSLANSCVNHTPSGCNLPRSLRGNTCNRWICGPLDDLLVGLEGDNPVQTVLVLQRRQNHWEQNKPSLDNSIVRAAVLTEAATTPVALPSAGE
jgi:hypothetical protein